MLGIVSYNMHGDNQVFNSIRGLINSYASDMFFDPGSLAHSP